MVARQARSMAVALSMPYLPPMLIRRAEAADARAIAELILPIIKAGASYSLDPEMSEADALAYWMGPDKETFVAEDEGRTRDEGQNRRHVLHATQPSWRRKPRLQLRLYDEPCSSRPGDR